jgi:single-strand DNA-binding protein
MANLNKVMLIGRLTRDPEVRSFSTGGKVAMFGFAVNNRRKNTSTGEWEDEPVFLDMEAFNRGETGRPMADLVEQHFHKGHQFFIEGHLKLDQWTAQDGQKRSRLKIIVDNFQFLEPRAEGAGGAAGGRFSRGPAPTPAQKPMPGPAPSGGFDEPPHPEPEPPEAHDARGEEEIPF